MPNKTKLITALVTIAVLLLAVFLYRGTSWVGCAMDQYNLKRTTHFSFLTGACTVDTPKGRVYVKSIRGFDSADGDSN